MDPAVDLIDAAVLSHRGDTNRLFVTRWDDAQSLHGETNNSLSFVETRRHKQLPSLLVDPTRMLKHKWFNNLQG